MRITHRVYVFLSIHELSSVGHFFPVIVLFFDQKHSILDTFAVYPFNLDTSIHFYQFRRPIQVRIAKLSDYFPLLNTFLIIFEPRVNESEYSFALVLIFLELAFEGVSIFEFDCAFATSAIIAPSSLVIALILIGVLSDPMFAVVLELTLVDLAVRVFD